jgi:hypothetical protein
MNFESAYCPKKVLYAVSKLVTSNSMLFVRKFSRVPKVTGRMIWPTGVATAPVTMSWMGSRLGCSRDLDNPIWLNVFRNIMFRELPPSMRTRLSLTSLMMWLTIIGYRPGFGMMSKCSLWSKVMGASEHLRYSGVVGETAMTSRV